VQSWELSGRNEFYPGGRELSGMNAIFIQETIKRRWKGENAFLHKSRRCLERSALNQY
jgi:hypothetical protein